MKKSTQIICAFAFGVVFIIVMLCIAIKIPYPTDFQFLTFRVTLALAAGGIAAMLPGFIALEISRLIRAGGALAAFAAIYFVNPASLAVQGHPAQAAGVFVTELPQDKNLVEYFWKQADVKFRFPEDGWEISTKAAEAGLGDLTLQHTSGKDTQIQIHVSVLDDKYRDKWKEFETNTVGMWRGTISQFGPFDSRELFVDGRSAFRINGVIKGEVQGLKNVDLIYTPLGDNRLLEVHLTRNADHPQNPELERAFNLIISTIKFVR